LKRVYAQTRKGSAATAILQRSKTYKRISRGELEQAIGMPIAKELWDALGNDGDVVAPSLIIMSGVPLSGKTTLAKAIVSGAQQSAILVENDAVRKSVARAMGNSSPRFTAKESTMTYNVSYELIRLGLAHGCHVVFDATNLNDRDREGAYAAARELGSSAVVVFVDAGRRTLESRYGSANKDQQRAYNKLGERKHGKSGCTVPFVQANADDSLDVLLETLSAGLPFPVAGHRPS
jgi:predicted kinase